jgi:hypothetical protein
MRHRFDSSPAFEVIPIEKIEIPLKSRDELPPTLVGLQWIWGHPQLKEQIFGLLEKHILAGKAATGRTGMDLWQILVLGVTRLALDADWDRMEYLANYDSLLRQMLGVPLTAWGQPGKTFNHQTLRDNVALLDEALLKEINVLVAAAGRAEFKKKGDESGDPLAIKVDTYVLETDVHFPTDLNLLLDSGRKCLDLLDKHLDRKDYDLPGWRKLEDWQGRLKASERAATKACTSGGPDREKRVSSAVESYLRVARELSAKVSESLLSMCDQAADHNDWESLAYFHGMLDKHIDLVDRRLLQKQIIPVCEKVYSIFETHTEWIDKGKRNAELGHRLLIAADQDQLIHDYAILLNQGDMGQSVPVTDRLLGRYGVDRIASISFDKGFTRGADRELLDLYIPMVVMPRRGKKNAAQTAEESAPPFVKLRHAHSAVESAINALEHHGLNRCLDVGWEGYVRYVGMGVLAYNLHFIGRQLQEKRRSIALAA